MMKIRQELVIHIPSQMIETAFLSVPAWADLHGRGGIVRDRTRRDQLAPGRSLPLYDLPKGCKLSYEDHLSRLGLSTKELLVVVGARNLGNNLRIVAYKSNAGLLELFGENASKSSRWYSCLCCMQNGAMEPHRLRFTGASTFESDPPCVRQVEWAISGQPLVWGDDKFDDARVMLSTYDLRHYYRIPTGDGRFGIRGHAGDIVEDLVTLLVDTEDAKRVRDRADQLGLSRETDYLHSAIGLTEGGDVILAQLHGPLELVADRLRHAGASHGIELDQGGSVSTHFVSRHRAGSTVNEWRIFASHYFRPRASALLVFKLQGEKDDKGNAYVAVEEHSGLGLAQGEGTMT